MVRTMIQLTEEQMKALKALAKARKTSVAKLVRESVAQYIVTAPAELSDEEKRKRALEFLEWVKKENPATSRELPMCQSTMTNIWQRFMAHGNLHRYFRFVRVHQ